MAYLRGQNYFTFSVPNATGTLSGFVVNSYDLGSKSQLLQTVANESGQIITRRYDDIANEISIEAVIAGGTIPLPGTLISYNSVSYEVQDTAVKGSNKAATTVTIKAMNSQYI